MHEAGSLAPAEIVDVGRIARRVMRDGARGSVRAVFERSFYLVIEGQWICVGPQALGGGPLNALYVARPGAVSLPRLDDAVGLGNGVLTVGGRPFARLRPAEPEASVPRPWTLSTLAGGLAAFDALAGGVVPEEGLAPLARAATPLEGAGASRTIAAAAPAARHLGELVHRAARHGAAAVPDLPLLAGLIGLGPGLTPSGDDLLGGALVALAIVRLEELRDAIWRGLRGEAAARTNEISLAHLSAAADGECAAAVRQATDAILSGATGELPAALEAVAAIGHTSGLDALAGVMVVLRAFHASRIGAAAS